MDIQSPTNSLIRVLERAKQSSKLFQNKLTKNEASTRAVLIDPVLSVLGWDTTNLNMVEFEMFYANTKVDYALYDCSGKLQVIVEAKALGVNLSDIKITSTIVSYCLVHGVPNVFLTDGLIWQHYNKFTPGGVTPVSYDITKDPIVEFAQYLIQNLDAARFWPPQPLKPEPPNHPMLARITTLENQIAVLQAELQAIQKSTNTDPRTRAPIYEWMPLDEFSGNLQGKKPPQILRLPDGSQVALKSWRDILAACCRFVLANNLNLTLPLPDRSGKKVSIFSYDPPKHEVTYDEAEYKGKKLYIYLNYDSNHCVKNAVYILGQLPSGKPSQAAVAYEN
ncbi:MAG: hypothetical protein EHM70_18360 [Chloroflexota bacterium]|nr:MAG: hypothetical protein EHM70_18360 [Chloroflexota bacterium]